MDGGHWNGSLGSADMTVNNLTITSGLFEAPVGNLTITGSNDSPRMWKQQ